MPFLSVSLVNFLVHLRGWFRDVLNFLKLLKVVNKVVFLTLRKPYWRQILVYTLLTLYIDVTLLSGFLSWNTIQIIWASSTLITGSYCLWLLSRPIIKWFEKLRQCIIIIKDLRCSDRVSFWRSVAVPLTGLSAILWSIGFNLFFLNTHALVVVFRINFFVIDKFT